MKTYFHKMLSSAVVAATMGFSAFAQPLTLPAPSPKAMIMQTVGLTDITIEYSSPGVKGRAIWGEVVKYDELWRAGANAATKITFSKDVSINGTAIQKGSYSIFIIPSTTSDWTIILNKNTSVSTEDYKREEDIIRINATPGIIPLRERLAYTITDFTDESATIGMEWEKTRVSFSVKVDTDKQALESINNTLGATWRTYANAARYMLDIKKDYETGMKYIDQSLKLKEEWFNTWIKAQLFAAKKNTAQALAFAKKAKALGDKNPDGFFYKDQVEKAIKDWSGKK